MKTKVSTGRPIVLNVVQSSVLRSARVSSLRAASVRNQPMKRLVIRSQPS